MFLSMNPTPLPAKLARCCFSSIAADEDWQPRPPVGGGAPGQQGGMPKSTADGLGLLGAVGRAAAAAACGADRAVGGGMSHKLPDGRNMCCTHTH